MAECPCSNISIMQLFHELKQKYPAVPDRVVSECVQLNSHDKEACEAILSQEHKKYTYPGGRLCKMAADKCYEPQRPDSLQLKDTMCDLNQRLMSHQSLDAFQCFQNTSHFIKKQYPQDEDNLYESDENLSSITRLSLHDEDWMRSQIHQQFQECRSGGVVMRSQDSCLCKRTTVNEISQISVSPHSAPVTPYSADVSTQKRCSKLSVEPTPHYLGLQEPCRPFTSVNLTLRPPSSDPQPPINISSHAGGLTYSSCSYDPRQGYQSRMQISIGPGGQGTVTGARTQSLRPPSGVASVRSALSMPDVATTSSQLTSPHTHLVSHDLVSKQIERKERLFHELVRHKERLRNMEKEVHNMETDLESRLTAPASFVKVKKLREEINMLQSECDQMTQEARRNAEFRNINFEHIPLGETNQEFYQNIYRGQLFSHQTARQKAVEGRSWTCHMCTFHNHPDLNKCEQCEMPRLQTGAETQDIFIHVTHNMPSSPYRRVVHSWVV